MRIISKGDYMTAYFAHTWVEHKWLKGGHTVNVFSNRGKELDCYTFAWEKNRPSMLDFTTALESYLSEA